LSSQVATNIKAQRAADALVRFSRAGRGIGSDKLVCLLLLLLLGTLKPAGGAAARAGFKTGDVG